MSSWQLLTHRNVPRIREERGILLPAKERRQRRLYVPECPCGWRGTQTTNDTAARQEAITHTCEETHA